MKASHFQEAKGKSKDKETASVSSKIVSNAVARARADIQKKKEHNRRNRIHAARSSMTSTLHVPPASLF